MRSPIALRSRPDDQATPKAVHRDAVGRAWVTASQLPRGSTGKSFPIHVAWGAWRGRVRPGIGLLSHGPLW